MATRSIVSIADAESTWAARGDSHGSWRKTGIDLVVAHQYTPFFYALAARLFGVNCPIMFVEHGRFLPDFPRRKRMLFNRCLIRRHDRLIAVGEDVRRALIQNEGLPAGAWK